MKSPSLTIFAALALAGGARADVRITELHAAANERFLRWDATGQPRLGNGPAWLDVNFDASSWASAPAPFGMNAAGVVTNLQTALFNRTPSLYVRKLFTVSAPNAAATTNLRLNIDANDGFVCFINGKEAARARLGPAKMFIYADAKAFSARPAAPAGMQLYNLGAANNFLVAGDNVIAIQVVNFAIDAKGDMKLDAALELNDGILTTAEFTENFNNANGASRTHTNTAGSVSNTSSGTPPAGWLANAANPESDAAWSAFSVAQSLETMGGAGNTGNLKLVVTGTAPTQPAKVPGPNISMATQWPAGAVTEMDLDQTTLNFKYKATAGFSTSLTLEPAGGAASAALVMGGLTPTAIPPSADIAGWWRFENHTSGATVVPGTAGATIANAPSVTNAGIALATLVTANAAKYSTDLPGARILDPITGSVYDNAFSFDATLSSARFSAPNNAIYNTTSFTIEFFIKLSGEPTGFDSFCRRLADGPNADSATASDRQAWQVDYDHGATATSFGRVRSRWDTIGISPAPVDYNRVTAGTLLFVDNPTGSGLTSGYGASADVYTEGDQANDTVSNIWHHVAVTFDAAANRATIYTDYVAGGNVVLNNTWSQPAANLEFGKFSNTNMPAPASAPWTMKMDEVRYTGRVLAASEMLKVAAADASGFFSYSAKLSTATPASRTAFLAALNGASGQSFRPVFSVVDATYATTPGKELRLDDVTVQYARQAPITPVLAAGQTYNYKPGYGEPGGGVFEPNLPPQPNNPYDQASVPPFPDVSKFSDWIELSNDGAATVTLTGWFLSDETDTPQKWPFPAGTTIPAGGRLLVLCDENSALPGLVYLHTNFKLSEGGERVRLYNGLTLVDELDYPRQDAFHSYGRDGANALVYFDVSTPGQANTGTTSAVRVSTPDFWSDVAATLPMTGGYFTGAQTLYITTPTLGAQIRYTLNGTEPTATSALYSGSLVISPGANDRTGTPVRARAFLTGAVPSGTKSATFLINQNVAIKAVPAMCFTADNDRDFYENSGIMALVGGVFDANGVWSASAVGDYNMGLMHGRPYERPIYLEWLRNDGVPGFSEDAGLRLASSPFSRPRLKLTAPPSQSPWAANATEKPSFNIFFREDYDKAELDYPFLGQDYPVKSFDQLRPRAGKNDISNPFIKDELVRRLFNDMGSKSVKGTINALFLNGIYKGFFNTVERYRESYFQAHFDSTNAWDIRINDGIEDGDGVEWTNMMAAMLTMSQEVASKPKWDAAVAKVDLDECIDYWLMNIYMSMWDWPNNNWVAARERIPAGVWRLHIWDAEGSFGHGGVKPPNYDTILTDLRTNSGTGTSQQSELFRRLYASPEFKLRVADRVHKWFFNGEVLDDRVPATCKIKVRADELKATFAPLLLYTHGATFSENFFNNWTTATTANPNAGTWTVAMSNRRSHLFNAAPTPASNISFRTHALWPATEPVTFAQHGGVVSPGYSLTIATNATVPAGSTVYYTTDGTEPRVWGGSVAAGDSSYVTTASPTSFQITVPGVLYTTVKARVRNGTTSEWSALTEATYQFAAVPATAANLVVSQIMYNPPDTTAAEEAAGFTDRDDFEYIELRNIAAVPVSLDNVKLIAGVSFDFATSVVSSPVRALAPGGTVLIVRNKPAFRQRYGNSLDAKIAGSYLGNLSNSGERLWITGPDGADADTNADTIKDFSYNDDSGWPEVADGHGSALRLLNPAANPDHALPASWAATLQWAGTPGALVIPVTFATWLDGHFNAASLADPLITGPNADPDNDGLGNLIEFVRGTIPDRPTANALAGLPTYTIASGPDTLDHLFAAWTVNAQTLATVTIVAEAGNDLTVWTPLTALPVVTNADGTATLTFRDETGRKSNPRRYVRFRVTSL